MTNKEYLKALNKLLKIAYMYGHQVGFAWYKQSSVMDINGHLYNENKILKEMKDAAAELIPLFGMEPEEIKVIMIEDGWRSEDWDYIPPFIAAFTKGDDN